MRNVDKPALNYVALRDRIERLRRDGGGPGLRATLPDRRRTFLQKARLFPGVTFLVGYDTFERIGAAIYLYPAHRARS